MKDSFTPVLTDDGSLTFSSRRYDETFHSQVGARTEAREKFVFPAFIQTNLRFQNELRLLDIGFGLGYNAAEALRALSPRAIHIDAIEIAPDTLALARSAHEREETPAIRTFIERITRTHRYEAPGIRARLYVDDARRAIANELRDARYTAIFLDAFSTKKNPELWTLDFFRMLANRLSPVGVIVTYASAYPVISAFLEAGLIVKETLPVGRKNAGIIAMKTPYAAFKRLNQAHNEERVHTTGILAYRDETLSRTADEIRRDYAARRDAYLRNGGMTIKAYRKMKSTGC